MLRHRLKIAWTVFFAVLTVAACVLWVRSSWWKERELLFFKIIGERPLAIDSRHGRVTMFYAPGTGWMGLGDETLTVPVLDGWPDASGTGFRFVRASPFGFFIIVPYWFLVSGAALSASAPWTGWSSRFSVRTMLIVTMLVAVGLGLVAWASRR